MQDPKARDPEIANEQTDRKEHTPSNEQSVAPELYQEIAEDLLREGYVGVTPALVGQVDRQLREGKPPGDVLGQVIRKSLQDRLG